MVQLFHFFDNPCQHNSDGFIRLFHSDFRGRFKTEYSKCPIRHIFRMLLFVGIRFKSYWHGVPT